MVSTTHASEDGIDDTPRIAYYKYQPIGREKDENRVYTSILNERSF